MANYALSYDYISVLTFHEQLAAFVKANRHVTQWSQPYVGLFLLKSETDLQTLATSFREFFAGKFHLIVPIAIISEYGIVTANAQGILPMSVWDWLNQGQPSALSGLLGYGVLPPKQD